MSSAVKFAAMIMFFINVHQSTFQYQQTARTSNIESNGMFFFFFSRAVHTKYNCHLMGLLTESSLSRFWHVNFSSHAVLMNLHQQSKGLEAQLFLQHIVAINGLFGCFS